MPLPAQQTTTINIFRGFNKNAPYSVSGSPITASGQLKQNVEDGRFGFLPNGLLWTTVIDLPQPTDIRDGWNSFISAMVPANADTVLIQDYPIPGWCTAFMVVAVQRRGRLTPANSLRAYMDRCTPQQGQCPTGGGSVTVGCCANALPTTLHLTITDSGSCPCIDGTYTLTWDPNYTGGGLLANPGAWVGSATLCGFALTFVLYCNAFNNWGTYIIGGGAGFAAPYNVSSSSCVPFNVVAGGSVAGQFLNNCSGNITLNFTT